MSRPTGDRLINEAIKRILLDIVIRGHGDRLIGRWSREPELQQFLEQVPYMLDRINQLHLACCRKEAQDAEHTHHYHHYYHHRNHDESSGSGQGALDDFISLIGEDRHWLVRTRDSLGLTPLHKAVLFHNRPLVEYIVDRYQDELAASSTWRPGPPRAASRQPQASARLLDAQDKYGRTALHYAAALLSQRQDVTPHGKAAVVSHLYHFLVAKGASLAVQDFRGKTPPHYVRHPNQLRSKSIIHLANKLNANYQANVLTKTLRTSNSRAPIRTASSYESQSLRTTTTELHRESMSTSCNDLRRGDAQSGPVSELDRKRSQSIVVNPGESDIDTMMMVYHTTTTTSILSNGGSTKQVTMKRDSREKEEEKKRHSSSNGTNQLTPVDSPTSICSDRSTSNDASLDLIDSSADTRKQLAADRCPGLILDQSSKLSIQRCLNDGVINRINELLLEGHGPYLVREAAVSCWNLQCKRYISQVIPGLLEQVDRLHEMIVAKQLLAVKSLLSVDPILARIRRPYKRAAMNALHLAAQKNLSTIAKYLVRQFPELITSQDSNGATCLHWAAKIVEHDRLYRWLCSRYGAQLQPVRDLRGKTALDYRQQALRLFEFVDTRSAPKQAPKDAYEMLQQSQNSSDRLRLFGTKIDIKSRRAAAPKLEEIKTTLKEPDQMKEPIKIAVESPSTAAGSGGSPAADQVSVVDQISRRASSSAQPIRSKPLPEVMRRLSDSSSVTAPTSARGGDKPKADISGDRFRFDELPEVREETTSSDWTRAKLLNELAQLDSGDLDNSRSESAGTALTLASPLATPSLPLSRPQSASTSGRLESMIVHCIEIEDYQKLEHLILAGCGERVLGVYKQRQLKSDKLSARMRQFLDTYTPDYIDKIALIHQVLHKCYAYSLDPPDKEDRDTGLNAAFHKLCNLLDRNRLIMCRDSFGASPLHIALMRADDRLVDYLLRRHPDAASAPDSEKRNAVHYAALALAAYNQHGPFKLTIANQGGEGASPMVEGYWQVAENAATIYENICSRYGELLRVKDRRGLTGNDYLDRSCGSGGTHESDPINLSTCCQDYAQLLSRYNYEPLWEGSPEAKSLAAPEWPRTPDTHEKSQSRSDVDHILEADLMPTTSTEDLLQAQTQVKQVAPRPTVGSSTGFSTAPHSIVTLSDVTGPSTPNGLRSSPGNANKRHHRHKSHALLDDLDPNHRGHRQHRRGHHYHDHHLSRKSPTRASRQSLVGGVIVPTIIHNDKMDEIETYDIIYRQPPVNSSTHVSSSSDSNSFSSSDNEQDETPKQRSSQRQTKTSRDQVRSEAGDSSSSSELDDEDERVERLSNEFEIRVRREKNELRAKVDQIMNEIKMSAKSGKSSRFLASPIQPPSDTNDRDGGNTVMFLNNLSQPTKDKNAIPGQQTGCSLSSSGHSSCSSASSIGSTCSQSVSCSSAASRTANSSSCSTPTSSLRAQSNRVSAPQVSAKLPPKQTGNPTAIGITALSRVADQALSELACTQVISKNTYGQTYLHFIASRSQSSSTLYKVLEHGRHMIGERDIFYRTARDVALQFNLSNNVQILDKFIIDLFVSASTTLLNHLLNQGYSPLIHVSDPDGNDIMLILKLLKLDRMIHFLLQMADFQRWRDELHTFIRNGYSAGVSELIKKHPELVKAKSTHARTSLHLAVLFDRPTMVEELLEMDASSVYATDNMGRTALHYTYGSNLKHVEEIRKQLISRGASLEARDVKMRTPKYYYIFKREIEEIKRMELELN